MAEFRTVDEIRMTAGIRTTIKIQKKTKIWTTAGIPVIESMPAS